MIDREPSVWKVTHAKDGVVWKVTHAKDGVETIYLVKAIGPRDAKTQVLDMLYERNHPIDPPYTPEQVANDPFGLLAHSNKYGGDWTNYALCRDNHCTVNAQPFAPDPPYKLYSLNTKTGAMT